MGFRGPLQKGGQDKERKRRKEEGRDARREACQGAILHSIQVQTIAQK